MPSPHILNYLLLYRESVYKHLDSHTQTARPETTTCRSYKYLFLAGIEPAPRSASSHCANRAVTTSVVLQHLIIITCVLRSLQEFPCFYKDPISYQHQRKTSRQNRYTQSKILIVKHLNTP